MYMSLFLELNHSDYYSHGKLLEIKVYINY